MNLNKLEKCQDHAIRKNGLCLSKKYTTNYVKMLWQCSEGHQWEARWHDVKDKNSWCPTCDGQTKLNIKSLQEYAISKQGKLLSTNYKNNHTKMLWECSKGHQWEMMWNSIQSQNQWCPYCSYNIPNIEELQNYAKE